MERERRYDIAARSGGAMTLGLPALRSEICAGGAALPIKAVRRHPRASISGSREKEAGFFRWIRRTLLGREVVFFVLLLFFSAAAFFFSPVFHLSKGSIFGPFIFPFSSLVLSSLLLVVLDSFMRFVSFNSKVFSSGKKKKRSKV